MIISIAFRFVPTLVDEASRIFKSQASRGVDFKNGSFKTKTKALIVLIVPVHSYLFSICPVYSDRSCYLFLYLPISLCLYLSYVPHIYDVVVKISRLCCLRIAQPVLPSRFSRSFFITRYSLLFTVFRFSSSIFAISSSCLSSKNLRTTMARSFGSRFSIARFKSIFS